jgi:hypothetical protein
MVSCAEQQLPVFIPENETEIAFQILSAMFAPFGIGMKAEVGIRVESSFVERCKRRAQVFPPIKANSPDQPKATVQMRLQCPFSADLWQESYKASLADPFRLFRDEDGLACTVPEALIAKANEKTHLIGIRALGAIKRGLAQHSIFF